MLARKRQYPFLQEIADRATVTCLAESIVRLGSVFK